MTMGKRESIWSKIGRRVLARPSYVEVYDTKAELYLFIAPDYDWLTSHMCSWMEELQGVVRGPRSSMLRDEVTAANLESILDRHKDKRIFVVFYGHGHEDALLTAPRLGMEVRRDHGTLCHAANFANTTELVVMAYCCLSARILGNAIKKINPNNKYLGFDEKLSFCLGTKERESAFRKPFGNTFEWIIMNRNQSGSAIAKLKEEYRKERDKWNSLEYERMDEKAMLVSMLLDHHSRCIS